MYDCSDSARGEQVLRHFTSCKKEDLDQIRQIVKEKQIEILQIAEIKKDIDPNRDRYC